MQPHSPFIFLDVWAAVILTVIGALVWRWVRSRR